MIRYLLSFSGVRTFPALMSSIMTWPVKMFKLQQIAESTDFGLSREAEEMYVPVQQEYKQVGSEMDGARAIRCVSEAALCSVSTLCSECEIQSILCYVQLCLCCSSYEILLLTRGQMEQHYLNLLDVQT